MLNYVPKSATAEEAADRQNALEAYGRVNSHADRFAFLNQFQIKGKADLKWATTFSQSVTTTDKTSFSSTENYLT
eukprot:11311402-Heterocapsa_arctica.AAC.1